ncbi:hypothetical protein RQP46_001715 [Phenoliferia psychrophenolica]
MLGRAVIRSAARSYATAASPSTALPIQVHGLAGKYAGALFTAALKKSPAVLKQVEADLAGVSTVIKAEPSIQDFLANPVLSKAAKSSGIDALLAKASKTPSDITKNFFEVLAENGRLYESEKVINDFLEIMSAHRGEVKVVITSAVPLEKDIQKRLEDALKQSVRATEGKTMIFENKVSESVLGGLVVDFGDKTIDLSVASKVNKLNASLQEPI